MVKRFGDKIKRADILSYEKEISKGAERCKKSFLPAIAALYKTDAGSEK
jgi:hypothetical protein